MEITNITSVYSNTVTVISLLFHACHKQARSYAWKVFVIFRYLFPRIKYNAGQNTAQSCYVLFIKHLFFKQSHVWHILQQMRHFHPTDPTENQLLKDIEFHSELPYETEYIHIQICETILFFCAFNKTHEDTESSLLKVDASPCSFTRNNSNVLYQTETAPWQEPQLTHKNYNLGSTCKFILVK